MLACHRIAPTIAAPRCGRHGAGQAGRLRRGGSCFSSSRSRTGTPAGRPPNYADERQGLGRVLNLHRALAHIPSLARHFEAMTGELKAQMGLRRYELVTIAAALALRSSYCALAHASVLLRDGMEPDELLRIVTDPPGAALTGAEREMMAYAGEIARDAAAIDPARIERLRAHGFADAEISRIAATAALRSFFSKYLDAVGTAPDADYLALPPELREALVRGRAIAAAPGDTAAPPA
ncbi:peroxidase [Rhodobacteraceae bacterium 2CG4]|uniref:Peroxidase n=1 Tax=Halovulum marinum TaxID=2662447 RepID=A0A6L5YXU9_9RHOB|nr:carboxymuconolactone decarboxylase family protein [Halovulum marinum]MSU89028.1 peroxidase [Halovulum marinum]